MTLRSTISTPEGKRRYVRRLFATIADRYDFITGFLSYGQDRRWKQRLIALAGIGPTDRMLDLACGTGDLLLAAAADARTAVGLDVTHRMLQLARRRAVKARPMDAVVRAHPADAVGRPFTGRRSPTDAVVKAPDGVGRPLTGRRSFVTSDMLALPFGESCFDVVTTGYGLRNVTDLVLAIHEIHRVLAPGGRLLSLDFNKPGNRLVMSTYLAYLTVVGSALGFVLHGDPDTYRYIPESIRQYPGATGVARLMEAAGFAEVVVVPLLGGLMAIHVARKPIATKITKTE